MIVLITPKQSGGVWVKNLLGCLIIFKPGKKLWPNKVAEVLEANFIHKDVDNALDSVINF